MCRLQKFHFSTATKSFLKWLSVLALLLVVSLPARANTVLPDVIGVGRYPIALAFTPDGKVGYVVNNTDSAVSVIDTDPASPTFNTLIGNVHVGYAINDVAITPSGYAYVVRQGGLVEVIDANPASPVYNTVIAEIPITALGVVFSGAVAITPDGKRAYVPNHTAHTISVIDTDPASATWNTIIHTITVADGLNADPFDVDIAPDGLAYVTDYFSNTINVIDTNPASPSYNTVVHIYTDPRGAVHGSAQVRVAPGGRHVYIGAWGVNSVGVIDTVADTFSSVDVGSAAVGLTVTADGRYVYVAANGTNSVSVIDTDSNTVIDSLAVGRGPFGVASNGCYVYVTNSFDNTLSVIDRGDNCSGDSGDGGGDTAGATPVPALNPAALALLMLALGGVAVAAMRRTR